MKSIIAGVCLVATISPAFGATIAGLRHERRILILAAPSESDRGLAAERRALAHWREGAADRDVTIVEVVGSVAKGIGDSAAALRHRFGLAQRTFSVVLVSKDGNVVLRSDKVVPASRLQALIDAMPMRRAGER